MSPVYLHRVGRDLQTPGPWPWTRIHAHIVVFGALLLFGVLALIGLLKTLRWPFVFPLMLVFLGYIGLAFSIWPNIVPLSISLWDAALPPSSQLFILMYTCWSYNVFRGKVRIGDGYH
jgi:cytochrome d ubiquinol oxidase subunit II